MSKKIIRKIVCAFLMICIIFSTCASVIANAFNGEVNIANSFTSSDTLFLDIGGHWAEKQLKEWAEASLVHGYPDGTFRPDHSISRGEAIALINRSSGFNDMAQISFSDLSISDWEYEDVAKSIYAGYIYGYSNGRIGIKNTISRQETAAIIARLLELGVEVENDKSSHFIDANKFPKWSKGDIEAVVASGIMVGYTDGSFKPEASITRAEFIATLDRALRSKSTIKFNVRGTYGPSRGTRNISGDVVVNTSGVTLQNMKIEGNLLLAEGIKEGNVFLRNVTIIGATTVSGGGIDSIHIENSVLATVVINKSKGTVRLVLEDESTVAEVIVKTPVILEQSDLGSNFGFNSVKLMNELPIKSDVTLIGNFKNVDVAAKDINIEFLQGIINGLYINEQATDTNIKIENQAKVLSMILNVITKVIGQGIIEEVTLNEKAKGTTFEKQPLKIIDTGAGIGSIPNDGNSGETVPRSNLVVENGEANALIVIPNNASEEISGAADKLREYVEKSTGADLVKVTVGELANTGSYEDHNLKIFIGTSPAEDKVSHEEILQGMEDDGFIIDSKEGSITIIGPTDWGTEFGIYEFLERYVDVAWLMPGPDGEDVPEKTELSVQHELIKEEPVFISRHIFGTETWVDSNPPTRNEWARVNRMRDLFWSARNHNMFSLFDPEVFADHGEYYVGGVVPTHPYDWQPRFNDTTAAVAIQRICDYFRDNPDAKAYSLGINDSHRFCTSDPNYPESDNINSIGYLNMSDVYYPWVNKVVEGVLKVYDDKYFSLLAYSNVYDPPTNVKLNPRVIPYITDDRVSWCDPIIESSKMQENTNWENAAPYLGWYDYLYGTQYLLPRVYPHKMAENYLYAKEHNVIGQIAEFNPDIGEGPKLWLSAKLQWNPNQDVDALLDEWYERAVGVEAAPYLKQYYSFWERFWTEDVFETDWYRKWFNSDARGNYLPFTSYSYLKEISKEDLEECRYLMEQTVEKAVTEKQKKRAGYLMRSFEYSEASAISYPSGEIVKAPSNEAEALSLLEEGTISIRLGTKRLVLLEEFKSDYFMITPPVYELESWTGLPDGLVPAIRNYISINEPDGGAVTDRLVSFFEEFPQYNLDSSVMAIKTTATKEEILESLDFSKGPWRDAQPFSDFYKMGSTTASIETKIYLLWDDNNIYVGYENFDDNINSIIAGENANADGSWWSSNYDDSVETYITGNPEGSYNGYFTNPKDIKFVYNKLPGMDSTPAIDNLWEAYSVINSDRWNTVQVIPFSSIGFNPDVTKTLMGFFFRAYHGSSEFLSWKGGAPWQAKSFSPIKLVENMINNGSFEIGGAENPYVAPPWYLDKIGDVSELKRTNDFSRTGGYSLVASNLSVEAPFQTFPITPGSYRALFNYFVDENTETNGVIYWEIYVRDSAYVNLRQINSPQLEAASVKGKWSEVMVDFVVEPDYNGKAPSYLTMSILLWNFKKGERIFIDDVALYKRD